MIVLLTKTFETFPTFILRYITVRKNKIILMIRSELRYAFFVKSVRVFYNHLLKWQTTKFKITLTIMAEFSFP